MPVQLCKHRYFFVLVVLCLQGFGGPTVLQQYVASSHYVLCVFKLSVKLLSFTFQTEFVPLPVVVIELIITLL